jgi:aubergine-like protein
MFQAKAMEISLSEPQAFNLGDFQGKKSINEIEFVLSKKIKNKFEIVILVLPFQIKSAYKKIKQLCYLELGILSQIVLTSTLEKKGYKSICSKLVQQIIVKVGSKLWVPELSKKLPQNLMLVGADICYDRINKSRSVVAFCASLDSTFTKYYNRVVFQKRGKDIIENVRVLFKDSITEYFKENKKVPECIVYFRDGVTDLQEHALRTLEIDEVLLSFQDFALEYKPKLSVIRVEKRIAQKFFHVDEEGYKNPPSGTLIDTTIVSRDYDFYLIAQNVQRGTATPTHYKVVYDTTGISSGMLQELVYVLCFSYMNWSGAIRVPAPCQYAHKLSVFISQHLNEDPKEILRNSLYYL